MDGAGRWRDNVFVERLWRSLKYEEVYLHAYETVRDAQDGVVRYMTFYNQIRPHRARDGRMPDACTVTTGLYGPPPPRYQRPGTTYELAETAQTTGAISVIFTDGELR
jgi:putative transposase